VRVILDTNVVISGLFFGGGPRRILELWNDGALEWIVTNEILEEHRRVGDALGRRYEGVDAGPFLDLVARRGILVTPGELPEPATSDPHDERFFEAAIGGGVSLILSGDRHLLDADGRHGVAVLRPGEFLRRRPWEEEG
jgi:uncharacterized protein